MFTRRLSLSLAAACLTVLTAAGPAIASGGGGHGAESAKKKDAAAPGTSVEMPYLIAPIVADGRLTGYAYVSTKIIATSASNALAIRGKIPFIQDAFVRDVNKTVIGKAKDRATVDQEGLIARLLADTRRIMGKDKVANLEIIQIQISPLKSTRKR